MADITVAMINDLRKQTSAGMMDCKRALNETDGDFDASIKILREKGAVIQQKRANKESKQGIINAVASEDGKTLAMAEVIFFDGPLPPGEREISYVLIFKPLADVQTQWVIRHEHIFEITFGPSILTLTTKQVGDEVQTTCQYQANG